uniref:hypothetical protein n=1 Tax=Bacteroides zoogleoformans TaxID=28119 RepID=UPI00248D8576
LRSGAARPLSATAVPARDRRRRTDTADGDGHPAGDCTRGVPQVPAGGCGGEADKWGLDAVRGKRLDGRLQTATGSLPNACRASLIWLIRSSLDDKRYINFIVNLMTTFKICIFADCLDKSTKT